MYKIYLAKHTWTRVDSKEKQAMVHLARLVVKDICKQYYFAQVSFQTGTNMICWSHPIRGMQYGII